MNFNEIKKEAPFHRVEIRVSLRQKNARLILVTQDQKNPILDFPLESDDEDVEQIGREILAAARNSGLVDHQTKAAIVNLDLPAERFVAAGPPQRTRGNQ